MAWGLWDRIRGIGGKPEDEADLREEFGGEDPGEAEERFLSESGFAAGSGIAGGLSIGDAAEAAEDDLADTKPPPDPAP
jgi:hypothetical protein